jgi:hypothetical protein
MGGDGRIDEIAAQPPEARQGPLFVGASEPAVTDDIRHEDRRELSGLAHCAAPPSETSTSEASNHLTIGNRAEAGRLPPKGFPKNNRFEG